MKTKYILLPIVTLVLGLLVLVSVPPTYPVDQNERLEYSGMVCVYVNDELWECNHNLITNVGKNAIAASLGGYTNASITKIAAGNGTGTQVVGDIALDSVITDCGLAATTGSYVYDSTGAWNITYQWTVAGCGTTPNIVVNTTGLYNATGSNLLFAETTFTGVTLQNSDKLNVTWGLTVSGT
jgi:hypothetical protein